MKWETALWMVACLLLASLPRGQLETTCHAFVGETVVLPCTTSPPEDLTLAKSMLYWQIGRKIVHFFQKGRDSLDSQDKGFQGRTSLFPEQMKHGNLSLKISNVQLGDKAEYTCIYRQTVDQETQISKVILNVSVPSRTEEPPSPSGQSQVCSGSPTDEPCLAMLPLSFLLLVLLGVWHL